MSIGSVNSTSSALATQSLQRTPDPAQLKKAQDKDGDSDKGAQSAPPPAPTVNLNGQSLGQVINTSA